MTFRRASRSPRPTPPEDRLVTCSLRPVPDECALRIAHDLFDARLSGFIVGLLSGTLLTSLVVIVLS